jgi:hypothetical protein
LKRKANTDGTHFFQLAIQMHTILEVIKITLIPLYFVAATQFPTPPEDGHMSPKHVEEFK